MQDPGSKLPFSSRLCVVGHKTSPLYGLLLWPRDSHKLWSLLVSHFRLFVLRSSLPFCLYIFVWWFIYPFPRPVFGFVFIGTGRLGWQAGGVVLGRPLRSSIDPNLPVGHCGAELEGGMRSAKPATKLHCRDATHELKSTLFSPTCF